jgi:FMN-dependent oxidoreductase (nitrilotriacetate monooxygenase family)
MSGRTDRMKLGGFFHPTGNHVASWLHPGAQIDAGTNFRHYVEITQTAERAKFDLVFVADAVAVRQGKLESLKRWPQYMAFFDPLTLMAGLAAVTSHIGLVATATTSYNEPYNLARRLASIDHMSGGRCGWNVVTSSNLGEAPNFGREAHFAHGERYERAAEFVEVVRGLWDSYDDDAFLRDRASAVYFDPGKLHTLNHRGENFSVRGPLNMARPPQGYPVFALASGSETGKDLAGRIAEVVFSPLHTLDQARSLYAELKGRAERYGRRPDQIKLMPGLNPIVGRTEAEAWEKKAFLDGLIHEDVGRAMISTALGDLDISACPLDEPLSDAVCEAGLRADKTEGRQVVAMSRQEGLTLRQIYQRFGGARGQKTVVGSPAQIADHMEEWFHSYGVDGFLVQPSVLPSGLDEFVDLVVPELQRRGLFRTEYEGATLRENLGLERPVSRYGRS